MSKKFLLAASTIYIIKATIKFFKVTIILFTQNNQIVEKIIRGENYLSKITKLFENA